MRTENTIEEKQVFKAQNILNGQRGDKEGYCGCPQCGSRKLTHDGHTLDNGYIRCDKCDYSISGGRTPHDLLVMWNGIYRRSVQLKIPFIEKELKPFILNLR